MVKMNKGKIRDTTKQLKDENNLIKRQYRSVICCTFLCSNPVTHILITGLGCYPNYVEKPICNVCSTYIQELSDYEWDERGLVGVYELM